MENVRTVEPWMTEPWVMDLWMRAPWMRRKRLRRVQEVVERTVRSRYPGTDFPAVTVHADFDFDGDPILRVQIVYRGDDEEIRDDLGLGVKLIGALAEQLDAIEETAFVTPEFRNAEDPRFRS